MQRIIQTPEADEWAGDRGFGVRVSMLPAGVGNSKWAKSVNALQELIHTACADWATGVGLGNPRLLTGLLLCFHDFKNVNFFWFIFFFRRLENWLPRLSSYLESAPTIGQWGPWYLTKAILLCGSSLLQFIPFMVEGLCTWPPSLLRHYSKLSGNPTSWMSPLPHLSSALIQSSVAREKERL